MYESVYIKKTDGLLIELTLRVLIGFKQIYPIGADVFVFGGGNRSDLTVDSLSQGGVQFQLIKTFL